MIPVGFGTGHDWRRELQSAIVTSGVYPSVMERAYGIASEIDLSYDRSTGVVHESIVGVDFYPLMGHAEIVVRTPNQGPSFVIVTPPTSGAWCHEWKYTDARHHGARIIAQGPDDLIALALDVWRGRRPKPDEWAWSHWKDGAA